MVYFKDEKNILKKAVKVSGPMKNQNILEKMNVIPPKIKENEDKNDILVDVQDGKVDIFELAQKTDQTKGILVKNSQIEFEKKEIVHNFCSCTFVDVQNLLLIGGCRNGDSNLKSHDVLKINLISKDVVKVGHLPYGLSSHAAEKVGDSIFIVGGNKNFNIVTKKCLKMDIDTF